MLHPSPNPPVLGLWLDDEKSQVAVILYKVQLMGGL